jgi:hypothetical protein
MDPDQRPVTVHRLGRAAHPAEPALAHQARRLGLGERAHDPGSP